LGGASNWAVRLYASNNIVLTVDHRGQLWDIFGRQLSDPTNNAFGDGNYRWRGPVQAPSITFTNQGLMLFTYSGDCDCWQSTPAGPGSLSHSISFPASDVVSNAATMLFHSFARPSSDITYGANGAGDGYFRFGYGVWPADAYGTATEKVLIHPSGALYYTPDATFANATALLKHHGTVLDVGGANNTALNLMSGGVTNLQLLANGNWYDKNGFLFYDANAQKISPNADMTFSGPCEDASIRIEKAGGTGTANTFISPILINADLTNAQFRAGIIGSGAGASGTTELYRFNLFYYNDSPEDLANGIYFRNKSSNYLARIYSNSNGLPALVNASSLAGLDITQTTTRGNEEILLNCLSARQMFPLSNPYLGDAGGNFAVAANTITTPTTFTTNLTSLSATLTGTTNQVTFGGTNSAPVNAGAPVRWISVQVTGFTNAYRLPLYQ
jgi:hypothetical protein